MGDVYQKLRDSARGQHCTLQLPGVCIGGTDTTVLCHLPSRIGLKGGAMKVPDYWAVAGCFACHQALDSRRIHPSHEAFYCMQALERQWAIWFDSGLLRVAGDDEKPSKRGSSKIVPHPGVMRR